MKVLVTEFAAEYELLPGCEAVMEQVPAANGVTCDPLTVQIDPELLVRVTSRPDEALAVSD